MKKIITTTIAILSLQNFIFSQTLPPYVTTANLVAWYAFNGNAADSSGNANNAIANGATLTTDRNGNANSAYNFNGTSSYMALPSGLSTSFAGGKITAAGWVYFNSNASWSTVIKNWGSAVTGAYHFGLNDVTQKLQVQITQSNGTTVTLTAPTTITLNAWHHVAFTADGSTIRLYQDGASIGTAESYDGTLKTSFAYTNIGVKPGTSQLPATNFNGYLNGKLDEIGLWSDALTYQQILALYVANIPTSVNQLRKTDLISVYPNPASKYVTILANEKMLNSNYTIINLAGQEVMNGKIESVKTELHVTALPAGSYFFKVIGIANQQLIITK